MPLPLTGTEFENYTMHLVFAEPTGSERSGGPNPTNFFLENVLGHRSGTGDATPWSTPPVPDADGQPYYDDDTVGEIVRDNWQSELRQDFNTADA
jgi:hypothetical protein